MEGSFVIKNVIVKDKITMWEQSTDGKNWYPQFRYGNEMLPLVSEKGIMFMKVEAKGTLIGKNQRSLSEEFIKVGSFDFTINDNKRVFWLNSKPYFMGRSLRGLSTQEFKEKIPNIIVRDVSKDYGNNWTPCLLTLNKTEEKKEEEKHEQNIHQGTQQNDQKSYYRNNIKVNKPKEGKNDPWYYKIFFFILAILFIIIQLKMCQTTFNGSDYSDPIYKSHGSRGE